MLNDFVLLSKVRRGMCCSNTSDNRKRLVFRTVQEIKLNYKLMKSHTAYFLINNKEIIGSGMKVWIVIINMFRSSSQNLMFQEFQIILGHFCDPCKALLLTKIQSGISKHSRSIIYVYCKIFIMLETVSLSLHVKLKPLTVFASLENPGG